MQVHTGKGTRCHMALLKKKKEYKSLRVGWRGDQLRVKGKIKVGSMALVVFFYQRPFVFGMVVFVQVFF